MNASQEHISGAPLLPEEITPVTPAPNNRWAENPQKDGEVQAGGLLGSPRHKSPATPVTPADASESAWAFFEHARASETAKQVERAKNSASVFSILQYEKHADTGETMVTQAQIDAGLSMGSIKKFAYAWHDLDTFDDGEAEHQQSKGRLVQPGDRKPRHVHIVISCGHDYSIRQISNWFAIPSARVSIPRELAADEGRMPYSGSGAREKAYFDFAQYLTHEGSKQQTKHQYPRDLVIANFDFASELDAHVASRVPGTASVGQRKLERLMLAVMHGEVSLKQLRREHPVEYGKNLDNFKKWRGDFLMSQEPPRLGTAEG